MQINAEYFAKNPFVKRGIHFQLFRIWWERRMMPLMMMRRCMHMRRKYNLIVAGYAWFSVYEPSTDHDFIYLTHDNSSTIYYDFILLYTCTAWLFMYVEWYNAAFVHEWSWIAQYSQDLQLSQHIG